MREWFRVWNRYGLSCIKKQLYKETIIYSKFRDNHLKIIRQDYYVVKQVPNKGKVKKRMDGHFFLSKWNWDVLKLKNMYFDDKN